MLVSSLILVEHVIDLKMRKVYSLLTLLSIAISCDQPQKNSSLKNLEDIKQINSKNGSDKTKNNCESEESKEMWLFVHTANQAKVIGNNILLPVTRDIFAFTDKPFRKYRYMKGDKFTLLWTDGNSFNTDPPNGVFTWVSDGQIKEVEVILNNAIFDGKTISYSIKKLNGSLPDSLLNNTSLFVDWYPTVEHSGARSL